MLATLAAVNGAAMMLLGNAAALDPAEERKFHRTFVEQADQMRSMIRKQLVGGCIDSGALSIAPEPLEVPNWWSAHGTSS